MRSLNVKTVAEVKPYVLLVDDEVFNLEILEELLDDYGYQTDTAANGREACDILCANPDKYQVVLLDRMMPEMGGMEVTAFMKQHPQLRKIPVIMQSAKATQQDIKQGLSFGILYYLTKPFCKKDLLSIVDTALSYFLEYQDLLNQLSQEQVKHVVPGSIEVNDIADAKKYASSLACLASDPEKIVMGLYELIINAIEHGNLEIGYDFKSNLESSVLWLAEIDRRAQMPEHKNKKVLVEFQDEQGELVFKITDQGNGFDYGKFIETSPQRSLATTGRGIAVARVLCFDRLEFVSPGNQVVVRTGIR